MTGFAVSSVVFSTVYAWVEERSRPRTLIPRVGGLNPRENCRWRIVVRAATRDGWLSIEPISILRSESLERPVFQLPFDAVPAGAPRKPEATAEKEDDEGPDEEELLEETAEPSHADLNRLGWVS